MLSVVSQLALARVQLNTVMYWRGATDKRLVLHRKEASSRCYLVQLPVKNI